MKHILSVVLLVVVLTGCTGTQQALDRAMAMRDGLLNAGGCAFDTVVTADYGDKVYTFKMNCRADREGTVTFEVLAPESIKGITGHISASGGKLTFDDQVLLFELLADGQISPVSTPWLLVKTLRSGYIKGCADDSGGIYIQIDDSYADDALHIDVWTDSNDLPIRAELLWKGKRVVSMDVENFIFL